MRLGLISDTHFQNWQTFGQCQENRISKRLLKQRDNFLQAVSVFQKERVDCIIHGGDWVHSVGSVSNEVLNVSSEILRGLAVPILFVCGNHDTPVRISPKDHHIITNILYELSSNTTLGTKMAKESWVADKVCMINYQDDVDYDKIKGYELVVLHKTPTGSRLGNYTFSDGVNWRKLAAQNKFVAFGHIHQMQKLSENCFIMGSPMQLSFGDEGRRGVWVVDTDTNRCEFHKLDYPEFIVVDSPGQIKDDDNYYKLTGSNTKVDNENVISVVTPEIFEERIKSNDFTGIIREWLDINKKDETYLNMVKDIVEEKLTLVKNFYSGRLVAVSIHDFLSVGDVSYEIPQNGFTLVSGDSDSFSSNGSGKSSIMGESICWALFGETTKGLTGDDVIRRGKKDCSISLTLKDDKGIYKIHRSRKDGLGIARICEHGTTPYMEGYRQAERQEYLEKSILGFDKSVFLASIYFSQENLLMLAKLSDTDKTNMITDLLGFEQYDELQEKVLQKIHKFETDISEKEQYKTELEKDLAVSNEKLMHLESGIADKVRQIKEFADLIDNYTAKVEALRTQATKDEVFHKIDYTIQINELTATQDKLSNKIEAVRESTDAVQQEYNDLVAKKLTLKIELDNIDKEMKKLNKEIFDLRSVKLGVRCDKCGAMVTEENIDLFIDEKDSHKLELEAELTVVASDMKSHEAKFNDVTNRKVQLITKEKLFAEEQAKNRTRLYELQSLKAEQDRKETELLVQKERAAGEINKYTSFISDYSARLAVFKTEKHGIDTERTGLVCDTRLMEATIDDVASFVNNRKLDIEKLGFWKVAFSPKGIRSVLLDRFCNEINTTINGYLSTVSGGTMSIMVTPTKTIKSGEERNKIGMVIQLNGHEIRYEALSGGEKRRVDVSLCFGLNKFVSNKYQVSNGILGLVILDEVFSFLDKSGEESVAELLASEGRSRSIFVIDHALNLSSYADRVWVVKKEHDISSLEMLRQ